MLLGKLLNRRTSSARFLNLDDDSSLDLANLIRLCSDGEKAVGNKLFTCNVLCQSDGLCCGPREDEMSDTNTLTASLSRKASFENLLEQMMSPSLDKGIQIPDPEDLEGAPSPTQISKLHADLEKQIQQLNEIIQGKVVQTVKILDYPLASSAPTDEDEPVGFSDALCFLISSATKNLALAIQDKSLSLSHPDISTLRKRFYNLTSRIESLRKTRVKTFSQLNKQIIALLERMIFYNEGDRNMFSIPFLSRIKLGVINENTWTENSFESQFWHNYSATLESLKGTGSDEEDDELQQTTPNDEILLTWTSTDHLNEIRCKFSSGNPFLLSEFDVRAQLHIVFDMIDAASRNVQTAENNLKLAAQDFQEGKRILHSFSQNIRISNLSSMEISEILKVLRVSVATSLTFLKSIEKTTRISRYFISEGIQQLRWSLRETKDNKAQFSYKPHYTNLKLSIRCGTGILESAESINARSSSWIEDSQENSMDSGSRHESVGQVDLADSSQNEEIPPKGDTTARDKISYISYSPSLFLKDQIFRGQFLGEVEKIEILIQDRLFQAYNILCLPNTVASDESEGTVPFIQGLSSVLLKTAISTQPYQELNVVTHNNIQSAFAQLNKHAILDQRKKSLVKRLAGGLSGIGDGLAKLSSLILIHPESLRFSAVEDDDLYPDSQVLADEEARRRSTHVWHIRWHKSELGKTKLLIQNPQTSLVENYANFRLKTKASILLSLVVFTDLVLGFSETNLKAVEGDYRAAEQSLKKLYKKLSRHLQEETLGKREQLYYGNLIATLRHSHSNAVVRLARLSAAIARVNIILELITNYIRIESIFSMETKGPSPTNKSIDMEKVRAKKLEEIERYANNSLFSFPLLVKVPIKVQQNLFGI